MIYERFIKLRRSAIIRNDLWRMIYEGFIKLRRSAIIIGMIYEGFIKLRRSAIIIGMIYEGFIKLRRSAIIIGMFYKRFIKLRSSDKRLGVWICQFISPLWGFFYWCIFPFIMMLPLRGYNDFSSTILIFLINIDPIKLLFFIVFIS
jgi:hypothetical protein